MYRSELKKLQATKSGQSAGTTHESKWQHFTSMSLVNAVTIPQLPNVPAAEQQSLGVPPNVPAAEQQSLGVPPNVPAAEQQSLGVPPNLQDDDASTAVAMNDNDNDEFGEEGVSDKRQAKKNTGTKRERNFKEEALHLEKRKIKLVEERMMKNCRADEDEDCMFLLSILLSIKKPDDIQRLELRVEFLSNVTRRS